MSNEFESLKEKIKEKIKNMIDKGNLDDAFYLVEEYMKLEEKDIDIYSILSVIYIMQNKIKEAEAVLIEGLKINEDNFDINYNLAYIYELINNTEKANVYYKKAYKLCEDIKIKESIEKYIVEKEGSLDAFFNESKKIAFFVKQGMDSFIDQIIENLDEEYETRKIIVSNTQQIDEGMEWADICWFEWCDELIAYGSKSRFALEKKIICRLHRYEAFAEYPRNVNWGNVDKLIVVTDHLKNLLKYQITDIEDKVDIITINNGVDLNKYKLKERTSGYNIAYVGYIHSRKNPILLLQLIKKLVDKDKRYKLYIAGEFQDLLIKLYWDYQVNKMGLERNVIFEGWQNDISAWLEDKNYILSTSIHESFGYGIAEAMAQGIKPVIHDFIFSDEIWDDKYLFNTIDEACDMIINDYEYDSSEYRKFIEENYSMNKQINEINSVLYSMKNERRKNDSIFSFDYLGTRINLYLPYPNDFIEKVIYTTNNFYEVQMLEHIRKTIGRNKIIIDVGANIGNHSVYFANVCKAERLYSFEPQIDVFNILKKNIELNEHNKNVMMFNMGLGEKKSYADIDIVNKDNLGMSKLKMDDTGEIEINTMDDIILNIEKNRIDLIKIDVEGMGLQVLKGARKILEKYKPQIYIEAETENEFTELVEFLSEYNYKPIMRFNATPTYLFVSNE